MNKRKLILEIIVDQNAQDWHWIYDSMKTDGKPINGMQIYAIHNGCIEEQFDRKVYDFADDDGEYF